MRSATWVWGGPGGCIMRGIDFWGVGEAMGLQHAEMGEFFLGGVPGLLVC